MGFNFFNEKIIFKGILSFVFLLSAFLFFPGSAEAALTTGLESYWKLDEASGTRSDSVGTNHLTANGTGGVGQAAGKLGNAAQFVSANGQYLSIPDNASVSTGDIDFTVAQWVYLDSKSADQTFSSHYNGATNQRGWNVGYYAASDRFRFGLTSDGTAGTFTSILADNLGSPSVSTWYYVVVWHDSVANTINIQVNNGTVNSTSWSNGTLNSSSIFAIGAVGNPTLYMNGRIDSVGLWKRTLTTQERTDLYNSGTGLEYPFASAPGIPTGLSATAENSQVSLSWTAPSSNGSAITDYVIEYKLSSEPTVWTTFSDGTSTSVSVTVTGLTNGSSYDFRVSAINGVGTGSVSSIASTIPNPTGSLVNSLVAYWKLDEASGARADSVGTNNLTVNGTGGVGQASSGKLGNAAQFVSANSQYLSIADNASVSTGDIDFTVAQWVYLDSKSADQTFSGHHNSTTNLRGWNVGYFAASDRFRFGVSSDGTAAGFSSILADNLGSPSVSTWYYVVAWHDSVANTINIQVNNGTVNSSSWSGGVFDTTSDFTIGSTGNPSLYMNGRIDSVGLWKRNLTTQERTDLYNSGTGLEYPFVLSDYISITSPAAYRVFQRNGSNQANISITGTYHGSPTSIEASWNGGAYSTISASPSGGTFSGTLSNQTAGQGTLIVRFTNDTAITTSKAYVGIGDIFVSAGQSNGSGRGYNNQTYSHATLKAILFGNDDQWKELVDPTDDNTNQVDSVSDDPQGVAAGSVWMSFATKFMADQGVPVAIIPTTKGGTTIAQWQRNGSNPGDTTTLYGSMYRRIQAVGGSVKSVLMWQGENDVVSATSKSTYKTSMTAFANAVFSDFGAKVVLGQIGPYTNQTATNNDNIRTAQTELWAAGGNILPGPSLYDIIITDPDFFVHFHTDQEVQAAANRWWEAVKTDYYGGTDGRGPQLFSATYNAARTQITLVFTDETLPLLPATALGGFKVKNNGTPVTITSALKISSTQVRIVLASAAAGTITVSLGSGNDGYGATVPTDSSAYNLPAEIFIDQSTSLLDVTSAPTSLVATPAAASVGLSWAAPGTTNGGAVTDYVVEYKLASEPTTWTAFADGTSASTSATVTGLANGSAYDFRVSAVNGAGASSASSAASATPAAVPDAPSSLVAASGNASAGLSWSVPAANGSAITDYVVEYKLSSEPTTWATFADGTSTSASATVTGLANGSAYDFRVSATNGVGTGSVSSTASATPAAAPDAPSGLLASAGAASVGLSWTAPSANGSSVTDYIVEYRLGTDVSWATFADGTSTSTSATVTGLTAGDTYDFRVSAVNAVGTSAVSSTASQLPSPAAISSVSRSSGAVAWTTDVLSSSRVEYGPSSAYGLLTAVADTAPRVLSHSVTLPSLLDCVTYHYRVISSTLGGQTTVGPDDSFVTGGCTASASVVSSASNTFASGSGGSLSLLSSGSGLSLSVPAGFGAADADFQVKELGRAAFFASAGAPSGMTAALSSPFSLKAVVPSTGALQSSFLSALTVSFSYSDSEIAGLDESTLEIWRWDSPSWTQLSGCAVSAASNSVSCQTSNFSDFALFGTPPVAAASSGSVAFLFPSATAFQPAVAPASPAPSSSPSYAGLPSWQGTAPSSVASSAPVTSAFRFKKPLSPWSSSPDVKRLQEFLNARGFAVASRGAGSPGKETSYYGTATVAAVRRYQARYADEVLKPSGLRRPTGTFGPSTMAHANGELGK